MKTGKSQNLNKNESRGLYKKLITVALPIMAQNLISASLSLVDNLLVGNLGEVELATVGLGTQISFIFWMILFGFCSGTITYMAQFWGKKDLINMRRVAGIAATVSFGGGLIFAAASLFFPRYVLRIFTDIPEVLDMGTPFVRAGALIFLLWSIIVPCQALLKASQQTKVPLIISLIAFSINTILGFILIYGHLGMPKMGIMGAVTGVIISRFIELALYIYVIFVRKNIVAGPIKEFFSWRGELFGRVVRNSVFTTLNEMLWGFGTSMYNAAYGRIGVTEFAAVQAGNTILNLFSLACFATGDAMLILVGEKLGAGELKKAKNAASKLIRITLIIGAFAGVLLFLTSRPITSLFALTPDGVRYTILILTVYSCVLWLKVFNSGIITGVLRAGGDTRYAMITEVSCVWLIGVPLAFICALVLHWPIYLVVLAVQAEELVKMFILIRRYRKGKWVKDLVVDI
ncbi:MAG: MATE family efflux transporter [Clostridiales Family XIII bacterium]|jgi:putative MATE family efflux protein|nr:MATE family efflux transporter [Clostridiales Family XIII bacterium]